MNGTGNSTFGDAPLTVLGGGNSGGSDSAWTGNITLNANIAITFQGAFANQPVPTLTASYLDASFNPTLNDPGSIDPTVDIATTTPGGNGLNAVQMLTFGGLITDVAPHTAFFTLGFNGATATVPWSLDPNAPELPISRRPCRPSSRRSRARPASPSPSPVRRSTWPRIRGFVVSGVSLPTAAAWQPWQAP